MNKPSRLRRLQLTRSSVRLLTRELAEAAGGKPRLVSCDPGIASGCDPHCNETSETSTTTIIASLVRC
jgi:hypothetical protein